jgi:hypothetical protein
MKSLPAGVCAAYWAKVALTSATTALALPLPFNLTPGRRGGDNLMVAILVESWLVVVVG